MKVKKTYRIDEETADKLARLAEERGTTATEILECAIRAYGTESGDGHTPDKAFEVLQEQLQVKDRQIADLLEALRGAQALHAADKRPGLIEAADEDGRSDAETPPTWWSRFKAAWRAAGEDR